MNVGIKALDEISKIAASAKPAVEGVAQYFVGVIQRRLASGQGSTLGWSGRASSYSKGYADRKGRNQTPVYLVDTGRMAKDIEVVSGGQVRSAPLGRGSKLRGDLGQFIRAEDANVSIGVKEGRSADLARIHTSGTYSKKYPNAKPRPFMGLTVQEADEVGRMVARRLYTAGGTEQQIIMDLKFK